MLNGVDQYLGYLLEVNLMVSCIVCITKYPQKTLHLSQYWYWIRLYALVGKTLVFPFFKLTFLIPIKICFVVTNYK